VAYSILDLPEEISRLLDKSLSDEPLQIETAEIGTVTNVSRGVAHIRGLASVKANELIMLSDGTPALATSIARTETGVILLGAGRRLKPGDNAMRTHRIITTVVGDELLGRVVDPLGEILDGGVALRSRLRQPIEPKAPEIMDRAPVSQPIQTGIKAIDATIPIGLGQRELILGDRQTGKTALAVATLANQRNTDVLGIYCAIGQRASATARVIENLREAGVLKKTIVVATSGEDPPGLQYIAPYAATTMAEHFMSKGRNVVIVYDDLTRHARAYRELSLLLRRPPGREAYPGDIFYIHARLLERATHLREHLGGGSITALPVVETQAGNISAYIPTNLISITDGQIYLSPTLFQKGILPAIAIGRSVSRVGGKAQLPAYRGVVQSLKLAYAQFEELESFSRFSTRLDDETRRQIERGRRVREILKQDEIDLLPVSEQIAVLLAVTEGLMDAVPMDKIKAAEAAVRAAMRHERDGLNATLAGTDRLHESDRLRLLRLIEKTLDDHGLRA